ncbi:MAG: phosphoribosylglycinamide formyltransferase [Sediminibacterium sp.]|nr:phosphoribosylglycinamide formyltransferase [Sediminibacterium sp.]MDP3129590.1 phosphoribosylglycinamide formyltransferase [Sediminibacterium sp.]
MFKRMQQKWGVTARQFGIIFLVFGLTGTTTALLTRYITAWLGMDTDTYWLWKLLLRIGMLLLGYQFILLLYGALLGQWAFFWKYEKRLLQKLGIVRRTKQIAVFASGAGSNAEKIILYFKNHPSIKVKLVVCNKPGAGVISIAQNQGIPVLLIERDPFFRGDSYLPYLKEQGINFIVLAGFLWKIPDALVAAYPKKILNIHPALLPDYGGKGMYGIRVHEAVIAAGVKESGISIHLVDEHFDEGEIIFQAKCTIGENETPQSLAEKVHKLEHRHYPEIVEKWIQAGRV